MWSPGFQASGRVTAPLPRATEARPEQSFNFFLPPVWGTHSRPRNQSSVSFYTMWLSRCIFRNRNFQIHVSEHGKDSFSRQCYHCSKYFEALFLELSSEEVTSRGGREVGLLHSLTSFLTKNGISQHDSLALASARGSELLLAVSRSYKHAQGKWICLS